jgi:hypothetical protein
MTTKPESGLTPNQRITNFIGSLPSSTTEVISITILQALAMDQIMACNSGKDLCPEELSCKLIATDSEKFARLRSADNFLKDWTMQELVERARSTFGIPTAERCYCLEIPGTLGGDYALHNIGTIARMRRMRNESKKTIAPSC